MICSTSRIEYNIKSEVLIGLEVECKSPGFSSEGVPMSLSQTERGCPFNLLPMFS